MAIIDVRVYERLKYWVQLALPLTYDDSLSYMELLSKVVNKLNELGEDYNELVEQIQQEGYDYSQMLEDIEFLKNEVEKIERGDYISEWREPLIEMLDESIKEIWAHGAQFVQFGLTNDGYFYVDIPDNWNFLRFETGYDESKPEEWLHLIINY